MATNVTDMLQEQPPPSASAAAVEQLVPGTAAGMPPTAQTFYAVVNGDGSLARGFGAVSATRFSAGVYEVILSQDVTGSAYVGTVGFSGSTGVPIPGLINVVGRAGTPNGVFITTTNSTGTLTDIGFHLAVHS